MEINIKQLIKPTKVLDFGVVKVHLEGPDVGQSNFINSVKLKNVETEEQASKALHEYFKRLICSCVKKVEGITLEGVDWDITLTPDKKSMTDESFEIFNIVMDQVLAQKNENITTLILEFFSELQKNKLKAVEFKAEDPKKKE